MTEDVNNFRPGRDLYSLCVYLMYAWIAITGGVLLMYVFKTSSYFLIPSSESPTSFGSWVYE